MNRKTKKRQLTERQKHCLLWIRACIEKDHLPPTYREVMEFMGYRSTNAARCMLQVLETKGYIIRTPSITRGLKLTGRGLGGKMPPKGLRKKVGGRDAAKSV